MNERNFLEITGDFIEKIIKMTNEDKLLWAPLDYICYERDGEFFPGYVLEDIKDFISNSTVSKYYKDDSFALEKNGSYLYLIHSKRSLLPNENPVDNYALLSSVNHSSYVYHLGGLTMDSLEEKENAAKVLRLAQAIKDYDERWIFEGGRGPLGCTMQNILAD